MNLNQIPKFPEFRKLQLSDKSYIQSVTKAYLPYSDFNFTNLWSWDVLQSRTFSTLNGNLVVLFTDYRTSSPVLSFFGDKQVLETVTALLEHASSLKIAPVLKFIPEPIAHTIQHSSLTIREDIANHDYIFSVQDIAFSDGKKMKNKRRLANTFIKCNPQVIVSRQQITDPHIQGQILAVLACWAKNKQLDSKSYEIIYEEMALRRLFDTADDHELIVNCLHDGMKMIAFSIDEVLPDQYAISHFVKADISYRGVYEFMNQQTGFYLFNNGSMHWNWEQDLNLEGLKQLKLSYRPVHFLKKYIVHRTDYKTLSSAGTV